MKNKVKKKTSNGIKNRNKMIIIIAIIILMIALVFFSIKYTGKVVEEITGPITGFATSTALYSCNDSDNGVNYFVKGICKAGKNKYTDACYNNKGMWEYYCPRDNYACVMQETACPYGCTDGRCLKKGETVSEQTLPENNLNENDTNNSNTATETNNPAVNEINDGVTGITPEKESDKNPIFNTIFIILVIVVVIFVGWMFIKKSAKSRKNPVKLKQK